MEQNKLVSTLLAIKTVLSEAFGSQEDKPSTEQKFKEVKAQDGTLLSYDGEMPMAGMPVFVLDEAGQRLPAPDADYVLEDGSTLKVQGGVIKEVVAGQTAPEAQGAEGKVENAEAPATNAAPQAQTPAPKAVVESIIKEYRFQEQIDELKAVIAEKDKTITELTEKFTAQSAETEKHKQAFSKLSELVGKIADEPATTSKTEKKEGFEKKAAKMGDISKEIKEFRKKHGLPE